MACCSFVNENTGIKAASFPLPTMYSPVGSTSQPCGDLGQGIMYTAPGTSFISMVVTEVSIVEVLGWAVSLYMLCAYFTLSFLPLPWFTYSSSFFQFTAIIKSLS